MVITLHPGVRSDEDTIAFFPFRIWTPGLSDGPRAVATGYQTGCLQRGSKIQVVMQVEIPGETNQSESETNKQDLVSTNPADADETSE